MIENKDDARDYLVGVVKEKKRHQDYQRVTELAKTYYALTSGDGLDEMLKKIVTRETEEMFKQRKDITKHITPSIINPSKLPYYKASRKQPLTKSIDFDGQSDRDKAVNQLNEYILKYWGDKSLEEFFEWAYVDYLFIDPNAFILTNFDSFDPNKEKAKPFPSIITSQVAIDYLMVNEQLQYLTTLIAIDYIEEGDKKPGEQYTLILGDYQYQLTQVGKDYQAKLLLGEGIDAKLEVIQIDLKYFTFEEFNPQMGTIPAHRIGFIKDYQTEGRTCVSLIHCVLGILEKTLKINSEMDLSCAMVAFPQRFAYVQKCNADGCSRGRLIDGKECPVCHGSGTRSHHGSVMDVIELPMPDLKEDMIPLSDLLLYLSPPIDLLKFQDEYCDKLKRVVFSTMFNSEIFTRTDTVQTATEKNIELDNMNDTLYPFLRKYSQLWKAVVKDIATITELGKGLILEHIFPYDLKFKNLFELMSDLKMAKDSGASSATVAAIEDDINEILYMNRPEELKKIRIKNQFNPFRGFSVDRLAMVIGTGKTTQYNEILYLNIENIFEELEKENEDPWVYDLTIEKIDGLVKVKVDEIIAEIDKKTSEAFSFGKEQITPADEV
jgi:hypothetical protein